MSDDADPLPRGLVFPSLRGDPSRRRWRGAVIGVVIAAGLALIWPVYSWVGAIEPYVMGLPFSLSWVVGWLVAVFVALGSLYLREEG